jgi:hypothetical protein
MAAGVGTAGAIATLPTPDVTWLLHVTGRVLDGARLGVDVVENSPPVILWLNMPSVLLAGATGWDSWLVWMGTVSLLAAASLWACGWLLRRVPSIRDSGALLQLLVAIGLFLLPRQEFGQREHVTACLALPWLLVMAARAEGAQLPRAAVWAASFTGGLGLAIKPHFWLVWMAVAGVQIVRARSARGLLRPELLAPALVATLAAAVTLSLHPEWLHYARMYGALYARFERENPLWVGLVGEGVEWSWFGLLSLIAFAPAFSMRDGALPVLAAGMLGFHFAAALQMKGWEYHFLPAGVTGMLLAAAAGAAAGWRSDRLAPRVYRVAVPLAVGLVAWKGIRRAVELVAVPESKWAEADPSLPALLAEAQRSGRRETLLVLSTNIGSGWPLAHLAGADWALRHPSLWMLAAIYRDELERPGVVRTRPPEAWSEEEHRIAKEIAVDLAHRPPTLLLLPEAAPDAPLWDVSRRFRYMPYVQGAAALNLVNCLEDSPRSHGAYNAWRCSRHNVTVGVEEVR